MSVPERPQLRGHLAAAPEDASQRSFLLWDRLHLSEAALRLGAFELACTQLFDGTRTVREVQLEVMRRTGGQLVPLELFTTLASHLEEALFLDGERFRQAASGPVRKASCVGVYEAEPEALRRQMRKLFTAPGAAGLPEGAPGAGAARGTDLRAVLAPHIDYARGGKCYTFAFKELYQKTAASLFVVIGTSHHSTHRFTLTRKHFQTPLGTVPTDGAFIDRLVARYGDGLFDDELNAHLPEHSIELEVVFLQYLYEGKRDIRIVPLVVGSFHDCLRTGRSPRLMDDVGRMIEALQAAERETPEPVCYVISGDLAHIGPKFGDRRPVHLDQLVRCKQQDLALMERAEKVDVGGYFRLVAEEEDERRICGLPPTYVALEAARPAAGKLLDYDRYVHPRGHESVSFASAAFYR